MSKEKNLKQNHLLCILITKNCQYLCLFVIQKKILNPHLSLRQKEFVNLMINRIIWHPYFDHRPAGWFLSDRILKSYQAESEGSSCMNRTACLLHWHGEMLCRTSFLCSLKVKNRKKAKLITTHWLRKQLCPSFWVVKLHLLPLWSAGCPVVHLTTRLLGPAVELSHFRAVSLQFTESESASCQSSSKVSPITRWALWQCVFTAQKEGLGVCSHHREALQTAVTMVFLSAWMGCDCCLFVSLTCVMMQLPQSEHRKTCSPNKESSQCCGSIVLLH